MSIPIRHLSNASDLIRIRRIANECGYDIVSLRDADEIWESISSKADAQWLYLPSDDVELARQIRGYFGEDIER